MTSDPSPSTEGVRREIMDGVGTFERVIVSEAGRRITLLCGSDGRRRVIRRITADAEPRAADRARALEHVQALSPAGFAPVKSVRVQDDLLEIEEEAMPGFLLGRAFEIVQQYITVNVALSFVHDAARALERLLALSPVEPYVHGRISLDAFHVTSEGALQLVGLEGLRGTPRGDLNALIEVMRQLLSVRAVSEQAQVLLDRLSRLEFRSSGDLADAIAVYLARFDAGTLSARRHRFASLVLGAYRDPALASLPGEELTGTHPQEGFFGPAEKTQNADGLVVASALDPDHVDPNLQTVRHPAPWSPAPPGEGDTHEQEAYVDGIPATLSDDDLDWALLSDVSGPLSSEETAASGVRAGTAETRQALLGPVAPTVPPRPAPSEPSRVVIGDYHVLASIGRGGMGEIYLARGQNGPAQGGLVALKVLNAQQVDQEALDMLLDEARILAHIDHPNVLSVIDVGEDGDRHFLAAEYLEGRPLVRLMIDAYAASFGLDDGEVACIGAAVAEGLNAAHTATFDDGRPLHIVHRDVSPQNIFVTYEGVVKVIDFGVARAAERISATEAGVVKGKAAYMSPEQAEGAELDARSDVFSLSTCLWEMAAGCRLFRQDGEYETLVAVQSLEVRPPSEIRGRPCALDTIVLRGLERNLARRTPSAAQMAEALHGVVRSSGIADPERAIRSLMERLYGEAAREERALIGRLEHRQPTDDEVEALRDLSGIAVREDVRRVTWMADPGSLEELDAFGSEVLRRVEGMFDPEKEPGSDGPPDRPDSDVGTEPLLGVRNDTPRLGERASSRPFQAYDDAPAEWDVSIAAWGYEDQTLHRVDEARAQDVERSVLPDATTPLRHVQRSRVSDRLLYGLIIAALSLLVVALGLVLALRRRANDLEGALVIEGIPKERPAPPSKGAASPLRKPSERLGLERKTETTVPASTARVKEDPSVPPDAATLTDAATLPEAAPPPDPPSASKLLAFSAVRTEIERRGVVVSPTEGALLLDDGHGGALLVDPQSVVRRIARPGGEGYIVETRSSEMTAIGWIGSVGASTWFVRGLTINDCPATARPSAEGIVLRYGQVEVPLPLGGGRLYDVELSVPQGASGLRLDPLGLEFQRFGRRTEGCRTGWWGARVVLRRLPAGRYSVRWSGEEAIGTSILEVGPNAVRGGELLRADDGR